MWFTLFCFKTFSSVNWPDWEPVSQAGSLCHVFVSDRCVISGRFNAREEERHAQEMFRLKYIISWRLILSPSAKGSVQWVSWRQCSGRMAAEEQVITVFTYILYVCACTRYQWRGTPDESYRPPTEERCSASPETAKSCTLCHPVSCRQAWGKNMSCLSSKEEREYCVFILLTRWGPGWFPSCSPHPSWTCGRPRRGPAPAAPAPGWSPSDARCTRAAGWSASAAPPASPNTPTRAAWPSESAPSGQPGKNRDFRSCVRSADDGAFPWNVPQDKINSHEDYFSNALWIKNKLDLKDFFFFLQKLASPYFLTL